MQISIISRSDRDRRGHSGLLHLNGLARAGRTTTMGASRRRFLVNCALRHGLRRLRISGVGLKARQLLRRLLGLQLHLLLMLRHLLVMEGLLLLKLVLLLQLLKLKMLLLELLLLGRREGRTAFRGCTQHRLLLVQRRREVATRRGGGACCNGCTMERLGLLGSSCATAACGSRGCAASGASRGGLPCLLLGRNVGGEEPTHGLHLLEGRRHPCSQLVVDPRHADDASGRRGLGQDSQGCPRMPSDKEAGIKTAACRARGGGFRVGQLLLTQLYFAGRRLVVLDCRDDQRFQLRGFLLCTRERLPSSSHRPERASQGHFERLAIGQLRADRLYLPLQPHRHVRQERVHRDLGFGRREPFELGLEGLNPFRPNR